MGCGSGNGIFGAQNIKHARIPKFEDSQSNSQKSLGNLYRIDLGDISHLTVFRRFPPEVQFRECTFEWFGVRSSQPGC